MGRRKAPEATSDEIMRQQGVLEALDKALKVGKVSSGVAAAAMGATPMQMSGWRRFVSFDAKPTDRMSMMQLKLAALLARRIATMIGSGKLPLDPMPYGGVRSPKYRVTQLRMILPTEEELAKL